MLVLGEQLRHLLAALHLLVQLVRVAATQADPAAATAAAAARDDARLELGEGRNDG